MINVTSYGKDLMQTKQIERLTTAAYKVKIYTISLYNQIKPKMAWTLPNMAKLEVFLI